MSEPQQYIYGGGPESEYDRIVRQDVRLRGKAVASWDRSDYLAEQVIAYAKPHSKDPRLPQALHLAVRSTRFGCTNIETSKFSNGRL